MSLKLSELKTLHEKGLALLYLHSKEKRPIGNDWTKLPKKTWDELENSFEKHYNVGVRLGKPSKLKTGMYLGAIDCDVKSTSRKAKLEMNEALRKLGIDLDSAPIVMSGRGNGSKHVYVQTVQPMTPMKYAQSIHRVKVLMPGEKKPHSKIEMKELTDAERKEGYRIRAAWEISFMGEGQQCVLPPSIHPDSQMGYAWASPFTVKYCPSFDPTQFVSETRKTLPAHSSNSQEGGFQFKAVKVDLYETKLSIPLIKMIEDGEGCEDRSAGLFSVTLAMCRVGFTDNQILSVLSNEKNWIAEAAYEHTQSRDRGRAVQWLYKYTLLKARYETDIMRRFENKPDFVKPSKKEVAETTGELSADSNTVLPDKDGNGKPKPTVRNIVHVLEHFMGGGLVGFDEFANRAIFLKDTLYGGKKGREVADSDDLRLLHYLACHFRFEPSAENCYKAHALMAEKNRYHPVRAYLEGLVWDQVPRIDNWLREAFSASGPNDYLKAISRKVLVAAVKRVFEPGCQFDYVLVLEGYQGKGKSTALGELATQGWFTDDLGDIHQKDVVDQMTGKWIIELSELTSIKKTDIDAVKSFVTRKVDRVRPPYGRRSQDYPRQSIFIGSTNSSEYFSDETGNRRFWPAKVSTVNRQWVIENRDQLWAEAMMRYNLGEDIYLNDELEEVAKREQEKRFDVDEWEAEIKKIILKDEGGTFVSTDLWRAINISSGNGQPPMFDVKRIGKIMHRLGFARSTKRIDGVLGKCWVKRG